MIDAVDVSAKKKTDRRGASIKCHLSLMRNHMPGWGKTKIHYYCSANLSIMSRRLHICILIFIFPPIPLIVAADTPAKPIAFTFASLRGFLYFIFPTNKKPDYLFRSGTVRSKPSSGTVGREVTVTKIQAVINSPSQSRYTVSWCLSASLNHSASLSMSHIPSRSMSKSKLR